MLLLMVKLDNRNSDLNAMPEQNAYTTISRKAASSQGLKTYFTGKPCPHGHVCQRWVVNGGCDLCLRKRRKDTNAEYRERNEDKIKPYLREYSKKRAKENPALYYSYWRKRELTKQNACPKWADLKEINSIYKNCRRISEETGIKHHVDHIIPLHHPLVCGLHVSTNLQILTAEDNLKKNNKFEIE